MMEGITFQKSNLGTQTIETVINSSISLPSDGDIHVFTLWIFSLSIIVLIVFLPLNIYVLWLIITGARNGVASEFISLNLCVCEIIVCSNAVFTIFNITLYKFDQKSPLSIIITFVSIIYNISRPFFQCCVCVERYVAVIHPIFFRKYKILRYRIAISVINWITVLGISVICPFLLLRNTLYYVTLPVYLLVFSIKILCSVAVLKALRKPGPGEKLSVKDAESNRVKKKAFCVIVIILFFMFITYFPMLMVLFMYDSLSDTHKSECLIVFSYFMIFAGFVHPLLYLHRVGKLSFIPGL